MYNYSVLYLVMMYNVTTQFDSILLATEANKFCPLDKNAPAALCVQCTRYLFISVKCISMVSFLRITVLGFVMYMCTYLCVDLPQVDLMNFRVEYVKLRSGHFLHREAAERATKSREVDLSCLKGFHLRFAPK